MTFERQLTQLYPYLRRYAISLLRRTDGADDLVQDTMMRATAGKHTFDLGSNMQAWVTVIMRNVFLSMKRREGLERKYMRSFGDKTPDVEVDAREQFAHLAFQEAMEFMGTLSSDHRDVINLVAIQGTTYREAAKRCATAEGTIKSRLNRARHEMRDHLPEYD